MRMNLNTSWSCDEIHKKGRMITIMQKVTVFISKYMALIVLAVAALALFVPSSCLWIRTSWVEYLLMVIMFGMGLTLKPADFLIVFRRPRDIIIGCIAQFTIMPLLAFCLGKIFSLDTAEEAQVMLKNRGIEMTLDEVKRLPDAMAMARTSEGELSEDDLEDVSGGKISFEKRPDKAGWTQHKVTASDTLIRIANKYNIKNWKLKEQIRTEYAWY